MMVALTRVEVVEREPGGGGAGGGGLERERENHTNLGNILVAVSTRLHERLDVSQEERKESTMSTRVLA